MLSHDINLESAHFLLNCFASVDCCPCSAAPNACRALFKQEAKWSIYQKWIMCPRPLEVPSRWLGCLREEDRGTTSLACQVQAVPPPLLSLSAESHSWNLRRVFLIFVIFLHNRNLRPRYFTLESVWIRDKSCLATKLYVKFYTVCKAIFPFQFEHFTLGKIVYRTNGCNCCDKYQVWCREKSFSVVQLGEPEMKLSLSPNLKQKSRLKTFLGAVCGCSYRSTWLRSWGLDFYPLRYLLHAEIPSSCIHPGGIC